MSKSFYEHLENVGIDRHGDRFGRIVQEIRESSNRFTREATDEQIVEEMNELYLPDGLFHQFINLLKLMYVSPDRTDKAQVMVEYELVDTDSLPMWVGFYDTTAVWHFG